MTDPLATPAPRPRRWGRVLFVLLLPFMLTAKWWGPAALGQLAFFQLRKIEVRGVRYLDPAHIALRMRADTLQSVWADTDRMARRVASHPQISAVDIERRLPGTLVVTVREVLPIALVPGRDGLSPVDSSGRRMPIDPSRMTVDLPIAATGDTAVLALLARIRQSQGFLFSRISEAGRNGAREIVLSLAVPVPASSIAAADSAAPPPPAPVVKVRAPVGVSVQRLTDIFPVESDLARRQARVVELDLRYRDQVIARLQ